MRKEACNRFIRYSLSIFFLTSIIFTVTYPLFLELNSHIPGFHSTDEPYGLLWDSWRIKHSFLNKLSLSHTGYIAYPLGKYIYASGYFSTSWLLWHHFLSIFTTPVLTYNIQALSNLLLNAIFIYLLVFYLSNNYLGAMLSGIIFAFCPYQLVRIWQHISLSYNQWLLLTLSSTILLKEKGSRKTKIIFFFSLILTFSFEWSIMYFCIIMLSNFFIYIIFSNFKTKIFGKQKKYLSSELKFFKNVFLIGVVALIILSPQFLRLIQYKAKDSKIERPSAFNIYHRPFEDLFTQSARPLSYFLPALVHPIMGKFTEQFLGTSWYGESFTEHTLYLGWIPLVLAFIAFRRWMSKRKELCKLGTVTFGDCPYHREDFYIGFFIFLAIVAWLFSQPPWWKIGPIKVFMPSFFMYKILPMFRAYCRFGIVVMLAVAVLAGFGLKFILEKFKTQKVKIAITILFSGLVLFEFWNWPPYKVIDVSVVPQVYYWLKEQPEDFAIAEYPVDADSPNEMYKFYQTKHEKKIINGTIPGTYANKVARTITKLSNPNTSGVLKWMGVKYVIVHKENYLNTELVEDETELKKIPNNLGLKFLKSFPAEDCPQKDIMCVQKTGPIDVYEVVAEPVKPKVEEK